MINRGFEVVSSFEGKGINLPKRQTMNAAGYDLECAEDTVLPAWTFDVKPKLVSTGIKAYMLEDEVLQLYIRSSLAVKKELLLANSVGVIDADYYNNVDNEGHIMVSLINTTMNEITLKKGDRIAQCIFIKFLKTDDDNAQTVRTGGVGSTGVK